MFSYNVKYYKLLDKDMVLYNIRGKEITTLNIDKPRSISIIGDRPTSRVSFTSIHQIFSQLKDGTMLFKVTIPTDAKVVSNSDGSHSANKLKFTYVGNILNRDVIEFIFSKKAIRGENLDELLCLCAEKGYNSLFKVFHSLGANINTKNKYIHETIIKNGNLPLVQYMYPKYADISEYSNRAVFKAAEYGHHEIVSYLYHNGADIAAGNNYPLRWAATNNHIATVKYLLNNGIDINAENSFAIRIAAKNRHYELYKYLYRKGSNVQANDNEIIKTFAKDGKYYHVETIIRKRNINTKDMNEAAIIAIDNGYFDIARILYRHGADINADNNFAIKYAYEKGDLQMVKLLHGYGANIYSLRGYTLRGNRTIRHDIIKTFVNKQFVLAKKYNLRINY